MCLLLCLDCQAAFPQDKSLPSGVHVPRESLHESKTSKLGVLVLVLAASQGVCWGNKKTKHAKKQKQLKATESGSDNVDHSNQVTSSNPINSQFESYFSG